MPFATGNMQVGSAAEKVCEVPQAGVLVKNTGEARVWFGGDESVGPDAGFPLDAGEAQQFPGIKVAEAPVVPAPEGDLHLPALYARTADGEGPAQLAWMTVSW